MRLKWSTKVKPSTNCSLRQWGKVVCGWWLQAVCVCERGVESVGAPDSHDAICWFQGQLLFAVLSAGCRVCVLRPPPLTARRRASVLGGETLISMFTPFAVAQLPACSNREPQAVYLPAGLCAQCCAAAAADNSANTQARHHSAHCCRHRSHALAHS